MNFYIAVGAIVCLTCRPRPQNTLVSPLCAGTCLRACGCFNSFSNSGLPKLTVGQNQTLTIQPETHKDRH